MSIIQPMTRRHFPTRFVRDLSPQEVAKLTGLNEQTLRVFRVHGKHFTFRTTGRRVTYPAHIFARELTAMLRTNTAGGTPEDFDSLVEEEYARIAAFIRERDTAPESLSQ